MTIGERIKQARKEKGISQEELGKHLGIGKSSVCEWESGKRPIPIDTMESISEVLEVPVPVLMGWEMESNQTVAALDLSPEALALARRYDEIQDPLDRKMVECAVNIGLLRNAPHDARPVMPAMFSEEWFADRIYGEDPRVARRQDVDIIGRSRKG